MRHARVTEQEQDKASARGRDSRNVERWSCLAVSLSSDVNNDPGGPLPRAPGPRSGRVLSRGKDRRATEPRRRVSAHPGNARFRAFAARIDNPNHPYRYGSWSLMLASHPWRVGPTLHSPHIADVLHSISRVPYALRIRSCGRRSCLAGAPPRGCTYESALASPAALRHYRPIAIRVLSSCPGRPYPAD
jgi:hypothetical protein